jgi:hypothetical protein
LSRQEYATALATCFWLDDERLSFARTTILMVVLQLVPISWQHPSLREKLEVLRKLISEAGEVFAKIVLPREDLHARKMVDALVLIHFIEDLLLDVVVSPAEVKVHAGDGISDLDPFQLLGHEFDNRVLRILIVGRVPETLM